MASFISGTWAASGGHWTGNVAVGGDPTKLAMPRFRNVTPDGRSLAQWQSDCQAAAVAAIDATIAQGPNATAALMSLR